MLVVGVGAVGVVTREKGRTRRTRRGARPALSVAHEHQFTCRLDASLASAPLSAQRCRGGSTPASEYFWRANTDTWFLLKLPSLLVMLPVLRILL